MRHQLGKFCRGTAAGIIRRRWVAHRCCVRVRQMIRCTSLVPPYLPWSWKYPIRRRLSPCSWSKWGRDICRDVPDRIAPGHWPQLPRPGQLCIWHEGSPVRSPSPRRVPEDWGTGSWKGQKDEIISKAFFVRFSPPCFISYHGRIKTTTINHRKILVDNYVYPTPKQGVGNYQFGLDKKMKSVCGADAWWFHRVYFFDFFPRLKVNFMEGHPINSTFR